MTEDDTSPDAIEDPDTPPVKSPPIPFEPVPGSEDLPDDVHDGDPSAGD